MRSFRLVALFANYSRSLQFAEVVLSFTSATIPKKNSVTSIAQWILNNFSSNVFKNSPGVAILLCFWPTLHEKCPYLELFWSVFSCIRTEYGEIRSISPYPVRMRETTDQKNFELRHFSRSDTIIGKKNKNWSQSLRKYCGIDHYSDEIPFSLQLNC